MVLDILGLDRKRGDLETPLGHFLGWGKYVDSRYTTTKHFLEEI